MVKIAHIGAGSVGFGKRFMIDVMTRPALAEGTLSLIDINQDNLDIATALAEKMARQLDIPLKIEASTLKKLLDDDLVMGYALQSMISRIYFTRYVETMNKLQAIVQSIPLETA